MSNKTTTTIGVLRAYPQWGNDIRANQGLDKMLASHLQVDVCRNGNVELPQTNGKGLLLVDVEADIDVRNRKTWLQYLDAHGLRAPEEDSGPDLEELPHIKSETTSAVWMRLALFEDAVVPPRLLSHAENDIRVGVFQHINKFFKLFPWLKTWTDPVTGALYNIQVTYGLQLVEVIRGEEEGNTDGDKGTRAEGGGEGSDDRSNPPQGGGPAHREDEQGPRGEGEDSTG